MTEAASLDATDKKLLNLLQSEFPLTARPFAVLGEGLGISEDQVITRTGDLREAGLLRHLSAIFDVHRVGYRSTLVSFAVPAGRLEQAAAVVSAHPGVSHNYGRDHEYNLWFVLALPRDGDMDAVVAGLAERVGATKYHLLPNLKLYKIGVEYDVVEGGGNKVERAQKKRGPRRELTGDDIAAVRVLQEDLSLVSRPFAECAAGLGMSEDELLEKARSLQDEGIMRRFAGVIRHRAAGFTANGMACWIVPEDRVDEVGARFAAYPQVSHCYRRPTFEDWPYSVFTMIHAMSRDKCEETVREMASDVGIDAYAVLYSHTEYKKERVKYFPEG